MRSAAERKQFLLDKCRESAKKNASASYNVLNLPNDFSLFDPKTIKEKTPYKQFIFLPYLVQTKNHPLGVPIGEIWWERTYLIHKNIGVEKKQIICPTMFGKRCPICEEVSVLRQDYKANEKAIAAVKASKRQIFNIVDMDDEKQKVQILDMSYHQFGKELEEKIRTLVDRKGDDSYNLFWELVGGRILEIRFKEDTYGGKKFWKPVEYNFEDREDLEEDILESTLDLDDASIFGEVLSYEQIRDIYYCVGDESDEKEDKESEPDEKPKKTIKFMKHTPKEEEPSDKEPEPAEEKPKKMLLSRKKEEPKEQEPEEKPKKMLLNKKKEEPKEEVEEKPKSKSKKEEPKEESDGECPHGFEYGVDTNKDDLCSECEVWKECQIMKKKLREKK